MKVVLVLAALIGVIIAAGVIVLIIVGVRTWIVNRYNRKQRNLK